MSNIKAEIVLILDQTKLGDLNSLLSMLDSRIECFKVSHVESIAPHIALKKKRQYIKDPRIVRIRGSIIRITQSLKNLGITKEECLATVYPKDSPHYAVQKALQGRIHKNLPIT